MIFLFASVASSLFKAYRSSRLKICCRRDVASSCMSQRVGLLNRGEWIFLDSGRSFNGVCVKIWLDGDAPIQTLQMRKPVDELNGGGY